MAEGALVIDPSRRRLIVRRQADKGLRLISSASLVQAKGRGWSFQVPVNAPTVAVSWRTEVNEPRGVLVQPGRDLGVLVRA